MVITSGGFTPSDPVVIGDDLANYADQGGKIIMLAYSYVSVWSITGRLKTGGYMPLTADNNDNLGTTYDGLSTNKIFDSVTTLSTSTMNVNVSTGATVLAYTTNSIPLVAVRGNVMGINTYYSASSGDIDTLISAGVDLMLQSDVMILQSSELVGAISVQTNLISSGISADVTDVLSGTPRLRTLLDYDLVITLGGNAPINTSLIGDNLADYLDQGGNLISFAYGFVSVWKITGRLLSGDYMPLTAVNNDNVNRNYDGQSTHKIFEGIGSISTSSMNTSISTGATVIASHTDGEPFVAIKGNYIIFNAYFSLMSGPEASLLLVNAVDYLAKLLPDSISPTFESFPIDNTYEEGSTGNVIGWTVRDVNPSSYNLKKDGLVIDSGLWSDGDTITTSVDGLAVGVYVYELVVDDVSGNTAVHSVTIAIVDLSVPIFESFPIDNSYDEGSIGNTLGWTIRDNHPATFTLRRNGSLVISGTWEDGGTITTNLDGIIAGTYVFELVVTDNSGNTATHTVTIIINAITTTVTSSDTSTTSDITKSSETSTTSEITKSSENGSNTSSSEAPELPIPFSNIYVIVFSMLGLAFIVRKRK